MNNIAKLEIDYTEKKLSFAIEYLLGIYSSITNKDYALVPIEDDDEKELYKTYTVSRKYDKVPILYTGTTDESANQINPYKKKLSDRNQILYEKFVNFARDNCICINRASTKILAQELVASFSTYVGHDIDNKNVFPSIMGEFIILYPFIVKKHTPRGIEYKGITLKPAHERLPLEIPYLSDTNINQCINESPSKIPIDLLTRNRS